jgi:hypothetical protein
LPISWNEDWSAEQHHAYAGQTYHIGFYVQQASVTFKVQKVFTFVASIHFLYKAVLPHPSSIFHFLLKKLKILMSVCYVIVTELTFILPGDLKDVLFEQKKIKF